MIKRLRTKFSKKQSDNKGFTFVELLVAIAILATVIVPVFQVFIAATGTNSKARTKLQATITADSVLESAKSFSIMKFDEQCRNGNVNKSDFILMPGKVVNGSNIGFTSAAYGGKVGVLDITPDGTITGINNSPAEYEEKAPRYGYVISGIKQSNNKYDAVVVFTMSDYQTVSTDDGNYSEEDVKELYPNLKYEYKISIYVYKHIEDYEFVGEQLFTEDTDDKTFVPMKNAIAYVDGSKLDTTSE